MRSGVQMDGLIAGVSRSDVEEHIVIRFRPLSGGGVGACGTGKSRPVEDVFPTGGAIIEPVPIQGFGSGWESG